MTQALDDASYLPPAMLRKGMWVVVVCVRDMDCVDLSRFVSDPEWWKKHEKQKNDIRIIHPAITGQPVLIRAVNLPYIVVTNPFTERRFPLDTRIFGFQTANSEYVNALAKHSGDDIKLAGGLPCIQDKTTTLKADRLARRVSSHNRCPVKSCGAKLRVLRAAENHPEAGRGQHWIYECTRCSFMGTGLLEIK